VTGFPNMLGFDPSTFGVQKPPENKPDPVQLPPMEITGKPQPPTARELKMSKAQAMAQELLDSGEVTDPEMVRKLVLEAGKRGISLAVNVDPRVRAQEMEAAAEMERAVPAGIITGGATPDVQAVFDAEPFGAEEFTLTDTPAATGGQMSDAEALGVQAGALQDYFVKDIDPQHGLTASNRKELFAEPSWEDPANPATYAPGTANRPYMHAEPSVRFMMTRDDLSAEQRADLADKGEDSDVYKRFADATWRRVRDAHMSAGMPVLRPAYLDANSVGQWYAQQLAGVGGSSASMLTSLDDMVSLGLGRQAFAALGAGGDGPVIEQLRAEGVLPELVDQMKDSQQQHPVAGMVGSTMGVLNPAGVGGRAARWANRGTVDAAGRLLPLAKRVPSILKGGLVGGAMSLGQSAVEEGGRQARAEDDLPIDVGPMAKRAINDALISTAFSGAAELLGSGGRALMRRTRTSEGPLSGVIRATEKAPSMKGARATGPLAGLKDTPEMAAARKRVGVEHEDFMAGRSADPGVTSVLDDMAGRKAGATLGELDRMRTQMDDALRAENASYYSSPEGRFRADTAPLVRTLLDLKKRARGALFGGTKEVDGALDKLVIRMPLSKGGAKRLTSGGPTPDLDDMGLSPAVREQVADAPQGYKYLEHDDEAAYFVRRMNSEELDASIGNLDRRLREHSSRGGGESPDLKRLQGELREMYAQFRPNAATGGKPWDSVKASHHQRMLRQESGEKAFGVPRTKRMEESFEAKLAVIDRMKRLGADNDATYRQMQDALRGDQELRVWLDEVRPASMRAGYTPGGVGGHLTGNPASGNASVLSTIRPDTLKLRLMDPLADHAGRLSGRGAQTGMLASENDFGSAAWHAARQVARTGRGAYDAIKMAYRALDKLNENEGRVR